MSNGADMQRLIEGLIHSEHRRYIPIFLIEEDLPSEGQRMVSGNRSSGLLGIYLGESLEGKC